MSSLLHAISTRQPFVELILSGKEKFEYRSMHTNMRELPSPKRLRTFLKPKNQPSPRFWRPKY
jgi:hypothetical protein